MKIKVFLSAIALLASINLITAQTIDTKKSVVEFEISNMALNTVEGTFTGMTGNITFNPKTPGNSSIDVCVDAATVNTDHEKRDKHLKNEDFFEVETYKTICFKSSSIVKTENGFMAKGKLTMHGVTKDVEIPLSYSETDKTLYGELELKRKDYGVGPSGTFAAGNSVELEIKAVLK